MFPTDLGEHSFVYKPCSSDEFVASSPCGPTPSAAYHSRPYLQLDVLGQAQRFQQNSHFPPQCFWTGPWQPLMCFISGGVPVGSEHSLNTKFLLFSQQPSHGKEETWKSWKLCWGHWGGVDSWFFYNNSKTYFLTAERGNRKYRNRALQMMPWRVSNPADPNPNPVKISSPQPTTMYYVQVVDFMEKLFQEWVWKFRNCQQNEQLHTHSLIGCVNKR